MQTNIYWTFPQEVGWEGGRGSRDAIKYRVFGKLYYTFLENPMNWIQTHTICSKISNFSQSNQFICLFRCLVHQWGLSNPVKGVGTVAPLQGKPLQAAPPPHLQPPSPETQPLSPGCRSQSKRTGGWLSVTVAGRLLPVLPHDPGPSGDTKEKVTSGRKLAPRFSSKSQR